MNTIRLLVIEDDLVDQQTIRRALKKSFLNVVPEFADSLESADLLLEKEWDLILTDYNLPKINGVEILKYFILEKKLTVPIIVMTGLGSETIANEVMEAGAFDFLTKNLITPEGIGLAVRNAIRVSKQQKEASVLLAKIQEREQQLTETQKIAGLGSWEYNIDKNTIHWTEESFRIFGRDRSRGDLSYNEYIDSAIEEDRDILVDAINKAIKLHVSYEIITRHVHAETGAIIHVSGRGEPYFENGILSKLYGTVMDISAQKKTENELIKSRLEAESLARLKQDFLANMSHEIRTPMNAILGFTGIVLKEEINQNVKEKVERINQAGNNLLVIINDILDFSKIEAGQLEIEDVKFDLFKCLDQVKGQLEGIAENKNIRLIFNISTEIPKIVKGDSVRLNQILINLIHNGLKFTEKGFVEVRAKVKEACQKRLIIQFEVEDTGIGIAKNKHKNIFESFTQASSDTSRRYGGTGLGLAICESLVKLQNGELWLESEEGVGSVFKFTIDFGVCVQTLAEDDDDVAEDEIDLSGVKLLLVEDNLMNRELAIHFFEEWEIDYDVALNGKIGVDKIEDGNFEVVLMDLSMPVMDGYTATKKIRQLNSKKKDVPIIAMTANAFSNDIEKCFDVGMNDHISKPFKAVDLKNKIHSLVRKRRAFKIESVYRKKQAKKKQESEGSEILVSLDLLNEMSGGNKEFIIEMLALYCKETPVTLKRLIVGVENNDPLEIKAAAHKFRSPAGLLGVTKAVELAEFIELNVFEESKSEEIKIAIKQLIMIANKSVDQTKGIKP